MQRVFIKFSGIYKISMKYKRLHAVILSVVIHLIIVTTIGMLFTEHYWKSDEDALDVRFVKTRTTRDAATRKHRTMSVHTMEQTGNPLQGQISSINKLPNTNTIVNSPSPVVKYDSDILNPDDVAVRNLKVETDKRDKITNRSSSIVVPIVPSTTSKIKSPAVDIRPKSNKPTNTSFSELLETTLPDGNLKDNINTTLQNPVMLPQGKLGAILEGTADNIRGHIRIIRLKHSLSDWWQDPTAIPSLMKWMDKNTTIRVDMGYAGGALPLTDPRILDAPLIVMTGHDRDITAGRGLARDGPLQSRFTPEEHAALRKYIVNEGGMLFFDDCGFHGLFAHTVAEELQQIFPEYPLEILPHDHEIYNIHYYLGKPPTGGDVFWGNENNAQPTQFKHQKGIIIDNRLAVVFNRKDYLCAMETAEIESRTMLRLRRSPDVYRFMANMLIYALKYGGNTDRTGFVE
ncbi:MAG: DUF4159 domain-containing protein [Candidatus Poribacteria bacterium]|nr:DUF4159 domain-containing protein [Candidatus Poribacteria bacterium]